MFMTGVLCTVFGARVYLYDSSRGEKRDAYENVLQKMGFEPSTLSLQSTRANYFA